MKRIMFVCQRAFPKIGEGGPLAVDEDEYEEI
jgi:hypothetical protein